VGSLICEFGASSAAGSVGRLAPLLMISFAARSLPRRLRANRGRVWRHRGDRHALRIALARRFSSRGRRRPTRPVKTVSSRDRVWLAGCHRGNGVGLDGPAYWVPEPVPYSPCTS
jgi:hypothetical protein